jgi:Cu+-exporting ATPase
MIIGEPVPVPKKPGDRVTAGTINGKGVLVVRAERIGADGAGRFDAIGRVVFPSV